MVTSHNTPWARNAPATLGECAQYCRSLWRRYGRGLPRDLEADCWSTAALQLHISQNRLRAKPMAEQLPYACGIIRNAFLTVTARERRWRSRSTPMNSLCDAWAGEAESTGPSAADAPPSAPLIERISHPEVAKAFAALPARSQKLLEMWLVDGLSDQQIAQQIASGQAPGPSADAIKMQRHRAVQRLRKRMSEIR